MARTTYGEVKEIWGGNYPAGYTDAAVTAMIVIVDKELDFFEVATSGDEAETLATLLTYNRMCLNIWTKSDPANRGPRPVIWTPELIELRKRLTTEGTYASFGTVDTINIGDR